MTTENLAKSIRIESLKMVFNSKGSHIGSALSYVDILAILYNETLNYVPSNPLFEERDRFILSKGHACSSLYACLAIKEFFSIHDLKDYGKNDSQLMNHVSHKVPGVEFSTGSLGHGLPFAVGKAKALKLQEKKAKVFVLIGDGECNEGIVWETALFAGHHKLDNLFVIIDYNKLQGFGSTEKILNLEPLKPKFESFNWNVIQANGHNIFEILKSLKLFNNKKKRPNLLIANTIKGKGVKFMENKFESHYEVLNEKKYNISIKNLN